MKPFSAMVLWELLGELGPEPGALLHTEVTVGERAISHKSQRRATLHLGADGQTDGQTNLFLTPGPGPGYLHSSLLEGADNRAILASQQRAAPPLRHLLL